MLERDRLLWSPPPADTLWSDMGGDYGDALEPEGDSDDASWQDDFFSFEATLLASLAGCARRRHGCSLHVEPTCNADVLASQCTSACQHGASWGELADDNCLPAHVVAR